MMKKLLLISLVVGLSTLPVFAQNLKLDQSAQAVPVEQSPLTPEGFYYLGLRAISKQEALGFLTQAMKGFSEAGDAQGVVKTQLAIDNVDKIPFKENKNTLLEVLRNAAQISRRAGNMAEYNNLLNVIKQKEQVLPQ